ncbi:MAG: Na+:solute symporter [Bacteroidales bacterium]|nr:Na+:solute symporter [Bacteroidales bacterium]MDT8432280.1 sodium:solute symporter family protein [Bacteroidales bacterium]
MKLQVIDLILIGLYLSFTVFIGFYMKKRAEKDKSSYLLGGNKLPWYFLGLSNASGMFDISGTMWLVTIGFVYGLKSIWLPWLWPVFNQMFLMVYLSIWLRRSNVTTGAEWIGTRFGFGEGARLSHNIVVIFALLGCLGFLAYGFIGLGKFIMIFMPENWNAGLEAAIGATYVPHFYGVIFTLFAVLYAILGGMNSIVWADVVQYSIMTISAIVIAAIAMVKLGNVDIATLVPEGWTSPWFGSRLEMDWSDIIPEVNRKIAEDGYQLFSLFFWMMVMKGILVSAAGPAPNYDMQKILATKSPREAAKMSGFVSVVLMPSRYLMIAGFALLGILFYDRLNLMVGETIDFEQILPSAIAEFVPAGLLGLLLAGLLAAFMSTFAGTLNAAQAYITNDIYLRYINPDASNTQVKFTNYTAGILTVLVSIVLGFFAKNVNQVLQILVSALWGSYMASNILKWYWWRFNAFGYFWGMLIGIVAGLTPYISSALGYDMLAAIFPSQAPDIRILYFFPVILFLSAIGCVFGTFLHKPTSNDVLVKFYKNVRPWGFWKPIREQVMSEDPDFKPNRNFGMDMFNIVLGTIGQTALVALPIFLVIKLHVPMLITIGITAVVFFIMKRTWWDRLEN